MSESDGDTTQATLLALATWKELESQIGRVEAAALRNSAKDVEALSTVAHDLLDHHIAAKIEIIAGIRRRVARQSRRET